MSTEFKSLERLDREAAYELQERLNKIRQNIANLTGESRILAEKLAQEQIEQIRREARLREESIIKDLKNKDLLSQQDAQHRAALLDMSGALQNQLNQQAREFKNKLSDVRVQNQNDIKSLRTETNNLINNLASEVNSAFEIQNKVNRNHQAQIDSVKNDVRNLQQNIADQISWAKENLANCKSNISEMENDIAINRFQGQELERVNKSVSNAETLIATVPQGAIGNLTEARINLMDIREKAQISQAIFESLFEQSLSGIKSLVENIKHNKTNTKTRETNVDLAYWTNGKYTDFEEKVNTLEKEVNSAMQNPAINIEGLTDIIKKISILEFEEENLVVEAVRNIELSHNRNVIADLAINSLLDSNFIIKNEDDEGYIAQDFREGYYATLVNRNNEGHCVTVMVDSVFDEEKKELKNRLDIQSNTNNIMDIHSMQGYQQILSDAMKSAGGDVKNLNVEDAKVFDANAIKTTKLNNEQKQRLKL